MAKKNKPVAFFDLVQHRLWAVSEAKLEEINDVIVARLNGADTMLAPELAATARDDEPEAPRYSVVDGVGVLPIEGTLMKRANLMSNWSGGTSYELIRSDLEELFADPGVRSILLAVDSPGGVVDGCPELARWLLDRRGEKPIIAHASGQMTSAAYYLAAAADQVLAQPTALVGSIGVRSVHYDRSERDRQAGVQRTDLYAGKYKAAGSDARPLDADSRAYLQDLLDTSYRMFVDDVARFRGLPVSDILATEARIFHGAEAVQAHLVDRVATFDEALAIAREKGKPMNRETLQTDHPEVFAAILAEGAASVQTPDLEAATAAARAEGIEQGRSEATARAVALVQVKGPVDLTLAALSDGTEPGAFALQVLEAERAGTASARDRLADSLEEPVPPAGSDKGTGAVVDFQAAVAARRAADGLTLAAATRAVALEDPELHAAWLAEQRKQADG